MFPEKPTRFSVKKGNFRCLLQKKLLYASLFILTACGTMFTGTIHNVSIISNVRGADVFMNGRLQCQTPCSIALKKRISEYVFEVKKDGYQTAKIQLPSSINLVTVANTSNLSTGGTTDLSTGGFWVYNREILFTVMERENPTAADKKQTAILNYAFQNYDFIWSEVFSKTAGEYVTTLSKMTGLTNSQIFRLAEKDEMPIEPDVFALNVLKASQAGRK